MLGAITIVTYRSRGWGLSDFLEKSVTKVYGSTVLALRGGVNFQRKRCDETLEWPLTFG